MKHLKSKLLVATAMMLLCAVMLSSVSYAWFTLSTNPEIKGMEATIAANQNLEIALDNAYANEAAVNTASEYATGVAGSTTGNPYTWGNLVDLSKAFETLIPVMQPVKYTNTSGAVTFEVPKYGTDGRVASLVALNSTIFTDLESVTAPEGGVKGYSVTASNAPYYAFSVDFWVRTNIAGDLAIQTAEGINRAEDDDTTTNTVNNTSGAGSYIQVPGYASMGDPAKAQIDSYIENMRIAFVTEAGATVQATIAKDSVTAGNWTVTSADIVTLAANDAQLVKMYVYLDGETITNADAILADIDDVVFNIQFKNTAISGDQAMTGNDA